MEPFDEVAEESPDPTALPLFSLVAGEGDGYMLGLVAGDAAGGAWEQGYSAVTQQATLVAYQLIENRELDVDRALTDVRELDGLEGDDPVYRGESAHFRAWLDRAAAGAPVPDSEPSLDGAPRAASLGVAFRRDAERVIAETVRLNRPFHAEASSMVASVMASTAVAASCFGQAGIDLVAGVAEAVLTDIEPITQGLAGKDRLTGLGEMFDTAKQAVGSTEGAEVLSRLGGDASYPLQAMMTGLVLAATPDVRPHVPLEQAARIGGSVLGAAVGAVVGARVGIRPWPWVFANDTWFAEIGRRLVRGPDEVRDLPIPHAAEFHITYGERPGFY